jgi:hypothetical protein
VGDPTDALADPEPETLADQQRKRDREQIERAFPKIEPSGAKHRRNFLVRAVITALRFCRCRFARISATSVAIL